ncbi:MAG: winged helix DNA-binding protein [Dehalococcoidales bacterium]|nr:winged helix DNA-binding protein [Dehalococcoidales bacterium]
MDNSAFTDLEHTLWILLYQTRDTMLRVRDSELSNRGLTAVEAGALHIITMIGDKATPAMISKSMLRQHHSVTALLKRMEAKGLVKRIKSPDRKNAWLISLTEKGKKAYANSNVGDSLYDIMSVLSDDEKNKLKEIMTKLRNKAITYEQSLQVQLPPFP